MFPSLIIMVESPANSCKARQTARATSIGHHRVCARANRLAHNTSNNHDRGLDIIPGGWGVGVGRVEKGERVHRAGFPWHNAS